MKKYLLNIAKKFGIERVKFWHIKMHFILVLDFTLN